MLQEASVQSAAGAGQGQPAEAPVTAVVNVGDYHGYLRPEALTEAEQEKDVLSLLGATWLLLPLQADFSWVIQEPGPEKLFCQVQLIHASSIAKCWQAFGGLCCGYIQCEGGRVGHLGPDLSLISLGRTEEEETLDESSGSSESEEGSSLRGRWRNQH